MNYLITFERGADENIERKYLTLFMPDAKKDHYNLVESLQNALNSHSVKNDWGWVSVTEIKDEGLGL